MINFDLPNPLPYLNTDAVKGGWHIDYPSNLLSYVLQSADTQALVSGMWQVPQEVVALWTDDDDVITDALIQAQPWIVPPAPTPPTPSSNI